MTCCVQAAKWLEALSLWGELSDGKLSGMKPDASGRVVICFPHRSGEVIMYNSIMAACQHCSAAKWALELFQEMAQRALKPSTSSYNALLAACETQTMWEDCLPLALSEITFPSLKRCPGPCFRSCLAPMSSATAAACVPVQGRSVAT